MPFSRTFQAWKSQHFNSRTFQDFPGSVRTLDPWHPPFSIHVLYSIFSQSLSKISLVYLLAWYPPLHTPYISSPNHYLLFAAHAHTIATCSVVVLRLCPLIPVSLSTLYLELYLVTSHHTLPLLTNKDISLIVRGRLYSTTSSVPKTLGRPCIYWMH